MGLLIVNADDLGGTVQATDAIADSFAAGAITSATFMVHMPDSRRAAEIALEQRWQVGLHLNLTQPFESADVSGPARERQLRACEYFSNLRIRRLLPEPRRSVRRLVADVVAEQLERFTEQLQRSPTHLDSHNHAHTANAILAILPNGFPVRRTASRRAGLVARKYATTDRFVDFPDVERAVAEARDATVELMVHPQFPGQLDALLSPQWNAALQSARLGSYSDLGSASPQASRGSV